MPFSEPRGHIDLLAALTSMEREEDAQNQPDLAINERATADYQKIVISRQQETNAKLDASKNELFNSVDTNAAKRAALRCALRSHIKENRQTAMRECCCASRFDHSLTTYVQNISVSVSALEHIELFHRCWPAVGQH